MKMQDWTIWSMKSIIAILILPLHWLNMTVIYRSSDYETKSHLDFRNISLTHAQAARQLFEAPLILLF